MNRLLVISFALVFSLVGPVLAQKTRRQANRPPSIELFTSSPRVVEVCPFFPNSAVVGKPEVQLLVKATDLDGDSLNYEYSVTEGSISGKGKSVLWNLDAVPRGPHEVRVTVTDAKGGKIDAALTVTTVDASGCDRPPPRCPTVKVSNP